MASESNELGFCPEQTRAFLRERFRTTALVVAVPLTIITLLALAALSINGQSNRYASVFHELRDSIMILQVEISLAALSEDKRVHHFKAAEAAFTDMLTAYTALRVSDPDGDEMVTPDGEDEARGREIDVVIARHGIDLHQAGERFDLTGNEMPEVLEDIWEASSWSEGSADTSLEASIGEFIILFDELTRQPDLNQTDLLQAVLETEEYIEDHISGALAQLETILRLRMDRTAKAPLIAILSIFMLVMIATFTAYRLILHPVENVIGESHGALIKARAKAVDGERAKAEFLASMSHEIRTPMNGVIGMAELMAATKLDSRQRMFIDIVQSSARSLLTIIDDVLDFSKIDSGHLLISEKPFKISRLAAEPAQLVSELAASKRLEIAVRVAPDGPCHLIGDFGRLRQVLTNLLGNAVKFTQAGQIVVDISTVPVPSDSGSSPAAVMLCVEVEDTGPGIPADRLEHIFERFSQVDNSSTREHEGTGLGLAISRGLIELMGGTIKATSTLGRGTTFRFELPLAVHEQVDAPATKIVDVHGARVLVIDDNEVNRVIMREMLNAWRFDEEVAASGREGLQKLTIAASVGKPFDLVLLDHHMPVQDGEDILRKIRTTPEIAHTPVILLTSIVDTDSIRNCNEIGLQGYLIKPALASPLLNAIVDAMSESRGIAAPDPADGAETRPPALSDVTNVLIAEDNAVNRLLVEHILEDMGLTWCAAADGLEAIQKFQQHRPSIVLMDVAMPGLDGYQATGQIRQIETDASLPRTPIIGVTAHALDQARERCIEAGMDDYMAKPVATAELRLLIDKWMDQCGQQSPGTPDQLGRRAGGAA